MDRNYLSENGSISRFIDHHNIPNDKFLTKFFMAILFTCRRSCQKSAERHSPKNILIFHFSVWLEMSETWGFKSRPSRLKRKNISCQILSVRNL